MCKKCPGKTGRNTYQPYDRAELSGVLKQKQGHFPGAAAHQRLGVAADGSREDVAHRAVSEWERWQRLAQHPLTPPATADAARVRPAYTPDLA